MGKAGIGDGEAALEVQVARRTVQEVGVNALAIDVGQGVHHEHQAVISVVLEVGELLVEQGSVQQQLAVE